MATIIPRFIDIPFTRVIADRPELASHVRTEADRAAVSRSAPGAAYAARFREFLFRPRQVSLRVTILVLLVGLLLSTIGSIAGVAFVSTSEAIGELEANHFVLASNAATREISTLLEPAQSTLTA